MHQSFSHDEQGSPSTLFCVFLFPSSR
jgi:hypothetical protein